MSFSEEDSGRDSPEVQQDAKLKQYWERKVRRRSSVAKSFVGDSMELAENPKIAVVMTKYGTLYHPSLPRRSVALSGLVICNS